MKLFGVVVGIGALLFGSCFGATNRGFQEKDSGLETGLMEFPDQNEVIIYLSVGLSSDNPIVEKFDQADYGAKKKIAYALVSDKIDEKPRGRRKALSQFECEKIRASRTSVAQESDTEDDQDEWSSISSGSNPSLSSYSGE